MDKKKMIIGAVAAVLAVIGIWVYYRKDSAVDPNNPFAVNTATGVASRNAIREEISQTAAGVAGSIKSSITGKDTSAMTAEELAVYSAELEKQKAEAVEINALKRAYYEVTGTAAPENGTLEAYRSLFNVAKQKAVKLQEYTKISGDNDFSDNNFVSVADIERAITTAKQEKAKAEQLALDKKKKEDEAKALEIAQALRTVTEKFNTDHKRFLDDFALVSYWAGRIYASDHNPRDDRKFIGKKFNSWDKDAAVALQNWLRGSKELAELAQYLFKKYGEGGLEVLRTHWHTDKRDNAGYIHDLAGYSNIEGRPLSPRYMLESKESYQAFLRSIHLEGKGYDWDNFYK